MQKLKPTESLRLLYLAAILYAEVDEDLGKLYAQAASGDAGVFPMIYDKMCQLGRFDLADKIAKLMEQRK